jgi:hypothetical protein
MLPLHVAEYLVCHSPEIVVLFASDVLALFIVIMVGLVCVEVEKALIVVLDSTNRLID